MEHSALLHHNAHALANQIAGLLYPTYIINTFINSCEKCNYRSRCSALPNLDQARS
jgi:hypothetical protein